MTRSSACWRENTTRGLVGMPNIRRNKHDSTYWVVAHRWQTKPNSEPVPLARSGGAGRPLSLVSSFAQRGPGPLGSLSARLGGDPLRRCGNRLPALLSQSHADAGTTDNHGPRQVDAAGASHGAPDA